MAVVAGALALTGPWAAVGQDGALDVIAFGSCAREREAQPIWEKIAGHDPDLFLFIGDNTYADVWFTEAGERVMRPVPKVERFHEAYAMQGAQPGYQMMRRQCPVIATWDDHDYGANDGGVEFALKRESREIFFDFFGIGENDPVRGHEGVYHARSFGPEGRRVQVIMLDTRYNRDPLERGPRGSWGGDYVPTRDTGTTILGEAQWKWLEERLEEPADVRVIASSIQVISDEHRYETWGNFPHERERLYRLIDRTDASGVVFISGDRHLMDISRDTGHGAPYPMWDFTSSGMNQRASEVNEPNRYRVGTVHRESNFGIIRINWGVAEEGGRETEISLEGYGESGQLLTRQSVFLGSLRE